MTIYTEQLPTGGTPPFDEFAPVANIEVGDQFVGNGKVSDIDTIYTQFVAGAAYTFTGPSSSPNIFFGMTFTDGATGARTPVLGTPDPEISGVSTYTFTALTTGAFEIEVNGYSIGFGSVDGGPTAGSVSGLEYTLTLSAVTVAGPTNGNDVLFGGDAPTTIDLMDGNDTWTGVSETETFVKGMYIDSIIGGNGDDSIFGGLGNDQLDGGRDNDYLDFGEGNDKGWGGEGGDKMFGGSGFDILNGNSGDDQIYGGTGSDVIRGGKGADYIEGGSQHDRIWGGEQGDVIYGGNGDDKIFGDEGKDVIFGGSGGDMIKGGTFDDTLYGDHGADNLNGGSGNDDLYGGKSDDKLNGNSGDDLMFGGSGQDNLNGGGGDDFISGGAQADVLNGGNGADILIGGSGDDTLTGGLKADTFVFAGLVNNDVIKDFEIGVDTIDFTAYGPISLEDALSVGTQTDAGVLLDLKANGSVLLEGITLTDMSIDDFAFLLEDFVLPDDVFLPEDVFAVG